MTSLCNRKRMPRNVIIFRVGSGAGRAVVAGGCYRDLVAADGGRRKRSGGADRNA